MTQFASDEQLAYRDPKSELRRELGQDHRLTEAYCLAQLPLFHPEHPDAIRFDAELGYDFMGKYNRPRISLVGFVRYQNLFNSPVFLELLHRVSTTAAGQKIDWEVLERRKFRHHFTVCGRLNSRMPDDEVVPFATERLSTMPRFRVQLRGPWCFGSKNGRLYFPTYPELIDGRPALCLVQERLDHPIHPGFYVGCLQLRDHLCFNSLLNVHEADELFEVVASFREQIICEYELDELAVIRTHDDLILQSRVLSRIVLQ